MEVLGDLFMREYLVEEDKMFRRGSRLVGLVLKFWDQGSKNLVLRARKLAGWQIDLCWLIFLVGERACSLQGQGA